MPPPPRSTLFPYTTLFRSVVVVGAVPAQFLLGMGRLLRVLGQVALELLAAVLVAALRLKREDRKSTRLNSSHVRISYAVFCLKKKKPRDAEGSFLCSLLGP